MTSPWFALVESNTSGTGRLFASAARTRGLRPILLTADPERYPYAAEDSIDVLRVDTASSAAIVDALGAACRRAPLAGVTTSSEYFAAIAAEIARRLGLPGPDPSAVAAARDKHLQRERLAAAGVAVPAFRAARSVDEAVAAAGALGPAVVVKPVSGSGSAGVRWCGAISEVVEHAALLLAQERNERGQPLPRKILVESVASGPEYSVETFGREVVGVTEKHLGALPHFVEIGHDLPAALPGPARAALERAALAALAALGLGWGPAHTEIRLTAQGPTIIEVNPRLAGGFIPELVRLAAGIDMIAATIALAAGSAPDLRPIHARWASIRFLVAPRAGRLVAARGLEALAGGAGIVEARLYLRAGDALSIRRDFRDRVGHVITSAAGGAAQARAAAERAIRAVEIVVEP